ncbi:MAG: hypothetical protein LDL37_02510 [Asticcacaulis sp.]|uniref:hypothetical protein n=1 Tax=Asticcacaulis sp. TaxID=1872648 RepID=UPI0025C1F448|nr:hypothetical protein [Asticcacaulis sp.]MCA1934295.1 hypothetical protein [Asticcacaulis sp.]
MTPHLFFFKEDDAMRSKLPVTLLIICLVGGCQSATSHSGYSVQSENHASYIAAVAEDVRETKRWPSDTYSISFLRREGRFLLFSVTHLKSAKELSDISQKENESLIEVRTGGDGMSYTTYVNRDTGRVEKKVYPR